MNVSVIRSNRKTISIAVKPDGAVVVRAPWYTSQKHIDRLIKEKEPWIEKQIQKVQAQRAEMEEQGVKRLSAEELKALAKQAAEVIPQRAAFYAQQMGVSYGRISIRSQKTLWGSCSGKGNLSFNCLLMLTPPEIMDYVVVHELCHRKVMNHSKAFWTEVEKVLPDYRNREKWLKNEGHILLSSAIQR